VPGPRREPYFGPRPDQGSEPVPPGGSGVRDSASPPSADRPGSLRHPGHTDQERPARPPGIWRSASLWLLLSGLAIGAAALYLVHAAIIAPIGGLPQLASPAPPEAGGNAPEPVPMTTVAPAPLAPTEPAPISTPPPQPVAAEPSPLPRPAEQRPHAPTPRPAPKHAPAEPSRPQEGDGPPIDARDLPPPDTPIVPPPPDR
jgi:outer membrane biosynthesis protein TonB